MEVQSHSTTVRTTQLSAQLSEAEVHEAIAAFVISRKGETNIPFPGAPGVTWQVHVDDRTGEATATIRHDQKIDG